MQVKRLFKKDTFFEGSDRTRSRMKKCFSKS